MRRPGLPCICSSAWVGEPASALLELQNILEEDLNFANLDHRVETEAEGQGVSCAFPQKITQFGGPTVGTDCLMV